MRVTDVGTQRLGAALGRRQCLPLPRARLCSLDLPAGDDLPAVSYFRYAIVSWHGLFC